MFGYDFGFYLILILIIFCVENEKKIWDLTSLTCFQVSIFFFF